jgi:hypothetical protein
VAFSSARAISSATASSGRIPRLSMSQGGGHVPQAADVADDISVVIDDHEVESFTILLLDDVSTK